MKAIAGTYVLMLKSIVFQSAQVGKLGLLDLNPGYYMYVGSAFGPGGLRARVGRHRDGPNRLHWHIDYVSNILVLQSAWYSYDTSRREHSWAEIISKMKGFSIPKKSFGASDCNCESHLFYSNRKPSIRLFCEHVNRLFPGHDRIMVERFYSFQNNSK